MPNFSVTTLDLIVFLTYLLGTRIAFGWYFARKNAKEGGDAESYFLGGNKLPWLAMGITGFAAAVAVAFDQLM